MHARSAVALTLSTVGLTALLLTSCTPAAPEGASTPTPLPSSSTAPSPSPSPSPTELLIAGGAKPPQVFDGDCAAAISPEKLSAAIGAEVTEVSPRDLTNEIPIASVGGVSCNWSAGDILGVVEILPTRQVLGAAIPERMRSLYLVDCLFACSFLVETEELVIGGYIDGVSREFTDATAPTIAAAIAEAYAAGGPVRWQRDTSNWWAKSSCAGIVDAVSSIVGVPMTGEGDGPGGGYVDDASVGVLFSDITLRRTNCALKDASSQTAVVTTSESGQNWARDRPEAEPLELGLNGVSASMLPGPGMLTTSTLVILDDGVNRLVVEVDQTLAGKRADIARAVYAAVSGS